MPIASRPVSDISIHDAEPPCPRAWSTAIRIRRKPSSPSATTSQRAQAIAGANADPKAELDHGGDHELQPAHDQHDHAGRRGQPQPQQPGPLRRLVVRGGQPGSRTVEAAVPTMVEKFATAVAAE